MTDIPTFMPPASEGAVGELDRHHRRRQSEIPTISVLTGNLSEGERCWHLWTETRCHCVVVAHDPDPDHLWRQWANQLVGDHDLVGNVVVWLAGRLQREPLELRQQVERKTSAERNVLFDRVSASGPATDVEALGRFLLEQGTSFGSHRAASFPERLKEWASRRLGSPERLMAAVCQLLPAESALSLLVVQPSGAEDRWIMEAADSLTRIVRLSPSLPVGLVVRPETLADYFRQARKSHAKALLRETVVDVSAVSVRQHGSARRCTAKSHDEISLDLPSAECRHGPEESSSVARSQPERFLFQMLETCPETAGLFELNGRVGANYEVDLLSRQWQLAIEIDGFYHFQDSWAYRRDRRKDFALQKEGYLVLRFLADDVAARLEKILETVREAVTFQERNEDAHS